MAKTKTRDDAENYWVRREAKAREKSQSDDSDKSDVVKRIFEYMFHNVTEQINAWYSKYASKEGISMSEAKKRADKLDIKAYEEKAKKYVKEKDFSQQANDEMKIYNLTMKANRLELLKSEVALELAAGNDEYEKYVEDCLKDKTIDEMERQAGILGKTIKNNGDMIKSIVNASFYNATFSERIWANQDMLRSELEGYMTKAIIQGKSTNSLISDMRKRFDVSYYAADRLLRTEERRIQTDVAKRSYEENGFGQYKYVIMNTKACDECRKLDGNIYDTKDMTPGVNAPPMHPICHCSTVPYIDRKLFDEYLDDPDSGDMTFEEWQKQRNGLNKRLSLNKSKRINNKEDLMSITKSDIISMEDIDQIKKYFSTAHNITIDGFDNKDLFAVKATLAGVDDFINEFSKAKDGIKTIKYDSHSKVYGRMSENKIMTIGPQGLQSYGTGVHESAHALDFVMSTIGTNDFSERIVEQSRKQCGLRKNSKKLERILFDITNQFEDLDNLIEIYAYSMESEFGGNSNILTKSIFELTQGELSDV